MPKTPNSQNSIKVKIKKELEIEFDNSTMDIDATWRKLQEKLATLPKALVVGKIVVFTTEIS
jgi:hypothetical protein